MCITTIRKILKQNRKRTKPVEKRTQDRWPEIKAVGLAHEMKLCHSQTCSPVSQEPRLQPRGSVSRVIQA